MDSNDNKEKVILKRSALPGVDMSIVDLELVSTVKIRVTIVKKLIHKIKGQTFIGTRDQLDDMDVIQVGNLKQKYRVMKLVKMTDREGYIYRIKRIDGTSTTGLDINAVSLGDKASIVNRPTFDDLFNYACSLKEEIPDPVTVDLCETEACDKETVITQSLVVPCPPEGCVTYQVAVRANGDGAAINYLDCGGNPTSEPVADGGIQNLIICARPGQSLENPTVIILDVVETNPCGPCAGTGSAPDPIFQQYQLTGGYFGSPTITADYLDRNGDPQQVVIPGCTGKVCASIVEIFCAQYGSIQLSNVPSPVVYAINEPCPSGGCIQYPDLLHLGECP